MKVLDKKTTVDLVKLVIFMVVTTLATGVLVITIGNLDFGTSRQYKAEFTDATGVNKGDDIRIAGVKVGTVKKVEIVDRTRALITFSVQESTALSKATRADIRYRNLVGQRYISLSNEIGDSAKLAEGATIPVSQTSPALDLTVLFNGFKPLFEALTPSDINQLSYEIVQVFQGEGGTLEGLLAHTASVTSTLADRDQIISELIDNLNEVLAHIGSRDEQLEPAHHHVPHVRRRPQGRPAGDPRLARPDLHPVGADRRPGEGHPQAVRGGHPPPARRGREHRPQQGRARPGAAGAAHQAGEGRPDRDLRVLVQLLPLPVPGQGHRRRRHRPGAVQHRLRQVFPRMSVPFRERNPVVVGAISLAVVAALILAAFNAQNLPIIGGGDVYYAAFKEAGGLKANDEVRVAGRAASARSRRSSSTATTSR